MLFADNLNITDPRINLAIEETLLRSGPPEEDILLFYINGPSIIIGRHQNAIEEINQAYVDEHHIHVVRRLSGGGAVYHDLGNLNYSLILRNGKEEGLNFKKFTAPVVRALQQMGAPAEMSGRNDILVDGYKVSGNAIYSTREGLVCHGTLLYDTDLTQLSHALNVKQAKIESKGIKSVRSRVTNLHPYLKDCADIHEFRLNILRSIFENADPIPQVVLDDALMARVEALADQRYRTWEWNYGRSPAFNIQKVHRFPFGEIDARIDVHNGQVTQITFFGDYFCNEDIDLLQGALVGVRYTQPALEEALIQANLECFFESLSPAEFASFLYV